MRTPRDYQMKAIELGISTNALIADDTGLGKTLVGARIAKHRQDLREGAAPVLVVTTKQTRAQWKAFLLEEYPDLEVVIVDTKVGLNPATVNKSQMWIITHYEILSRHEALGKIYWECIIADEAHLFRNRQTDRAKYLKKLHSSHRVALTATPMDKHPAELWSLLNWLEPTKYRGYWAFFHKHVIAKPGYMGHLKIEPGALNPEALAAELAPRFLRRLKDEVAPELPPNQQVLVPLIMEEKQARWYKAIEEADDLIVDLDSFEEGVTPERWVELNGGAQLLIPNVLAKTIRLLQVSTDPPLIVEGATRQPPSSKLEWVQEFTESNPDTSFVIFTQFRETALWLSRRVNATPIVGGRAVPDVSKATRLVATTAAGGAGLDLPHIDVAIFVDTVYSSILMTQALGRIHRMNITRPKMTYFLLNEGTVDDVILGASQEKLDKTQLVYNLVMRIKKKSPMNTGTGLLAEDLI